MLKKGNRIVAQDVIDAIGTGGGGGGGLETGDIGIASFPIDESSSRRLYLNGQIIAQNKYEDFTTQLKAAAQQYPNIVCTEEEWQEIAIQNEGGQVGKFVIDDANETIRLPRIIKLQGTLDFTSAGDLIESANGSGGGLEVGDIGISPFVDESKNLRRYLNGQVILQSQFPNFTGKLKKAILTNANLVCTEDEWQAIKSNSKLGQVGKFVIDDNAKTIRLPRIVKLQGLLDLSNIGSIVEDGLPDHTHTYIDYYAEFFQGHGGEYPLVSSNNTSATRTTAGASASNPIYGNSNTVQEEAVQYPYFIQVANGTDDEEKTIVTGGSEKVGSIISILAAPNYIPEGTLPCNGSEYDKATALTFYDNYLLTDKILTCTYSEYDADIATYGQCVKFALDTVNEKFKTPTIKDGSYLTQALNDSELGKVYNESLPNIEGDISTVASYNGNDAGTGSFKTTQKNSGIMSTGGAYQWLQVNFDASRSSSTYQDGAKVQGDNARVRFFVVISSGVTENADFIEEYTLNNPFSLGDYKWSEVEIENLSWLKSDGGFKDGTVYPSYYDWILENANTGKELFKKSTDAYTDYDWVINTADNTFRLPTKTKTASGNAIVGNGALQVVSASNLNGNPSPVYTNGNTTMQSGIFASGVKVDIAVSADPTKSGIETSDNGLYLYFYVGETVKSVNIIDINALSNSKQDKATAVNYNNITNCITHIPQDIKLELNNGTLTLKAGSKVYVPNRFEADGTTPKFDVIVTERDLNTTTNAPENAFLFVRTDGSGLDVLGVNNCKSGTGITPITYSVNYMTDVNLCKLYTTNTSVSDRNVSFPLAICKGSSSGFVSIDQVFNGFGYVGTTVFALPGVKGLIPNGWNADGSLKNIEWSCSAVVAKTYSNADTYTDVCCGFNGLEFSRLGPHKYLYSKNENVNKNAGMYWPYTVIHNNFTYTNGVINSFNSKLPFHAVDYNDSSWISAQAMPSGKKVDLTLGASGTTYTAPANGWMYLSKLTGGDNQYATLNNSTKGYTSGNGIYGQGSAIYCFLPVQKGDIVIANYTASGTTSTFKFIYAEGEN
jgi:hypothetical protein